MYTPARIIEKKRDKFELTRDEIKYFIKGLLEGEVTDYQATALLMAIYLRGMSLRETVALTEAMLESGLRYDLSHIPGPKVDKHSTGGVGDKVSIILAPLAAACGIRVPMMAGRGLGFSGGTLDKLESIRGFRVDLSAQEFERTLSTVGCVITGQTVHIAPADKKLYALRDVTGTVECIPLIVASILSKKLAEGADALVLDVKTGSGAFMKSKAQAKNLAKTLTAVAKKMKLPCRAVITDMSQPLGFAVGNSLEIQESIEILQNKKREDLNSSDLKELTIHLCAHMLELGKVVPNFKEGRRLALSKLQDGSAWKIFRNLVQAQGGNLSDWPYTSTHPVDKLPPPTALWKAKRKGYLTSMNTEEVGKILVELGGGRKKASDPILPHVGMIFHKKLGNRVSMDEPLVSVYAERTTDLEPLEKLFYASIGFSRDRKPLPNLVLDQYQ